MNPLPGDIIEFHDYAGRSSGLCITVDALQHAGDVISDVKVCRLLSANKIINVMFHDGQRQAQRIVRPDCFADVFDWPDPFIVMGADSVHVKLQFVDENS